MSLFGIDNRYRKTTLGKDEFGHYFKVYGNVADEYIEWDNVNGRFLIKGKLGFDADNDYGNISWNPADKTLDVVLDDNVIANIPTELLLPRVVNKTGSQIDNGTVVYISGARGNRAEITPADASSYATSSKTIGVVTQDIPNNMEGFVTTSGLVRHLDTSAWVEGTCLYLSTTPGEFTDTEPSPASGNNSIEVAMVITQHPTQGIICVKVMPLKNWWGDLDAGNYSYFESDGTLVFVGNATLWKDINLGGVSLTKAAANQPDLITINGTNILTYAFDGGTKLEELHGSFELQHDYKEGTDLVPHTHIYPTTTGAGNIKIFLEYYVKFHDKVAVTGVTSFVVASGGVAWNEIRVNFDDVIDGTALTIGEQCHFRVYRDPTDAQDTYTGDVAIATIGVHYEIDTVGSRTITTK